MAHPLGSALFVAAAGTCCASASACSNDSAADESNASGAHRGGGLTDAEAPLNEDVSETEPVGDGLLARDASSAKPDAAADTADDTTGSSNDVASEAGVVMHNAREAGANPYSDGNAQVQEPFECEPPLPLADEEALLQVLDELVWQSASTSTSAPLQLSPDYVLGSNVRLRVDQLPIPAELECVDAGAQTWCSEWTWFRAGAFPYQSAQPIVAGVTCLELGESLGEGWDTCMEVSIAAGTVLRLRATIQDLHPDVPEAFIEFERPCAGPCTALEKRCEPVKTCFPSEEHCAACEGRERRECACAERAEGEACSFASSPDYSVDDVCNAGLCGG